MELFLRNSTIILLLGILTVTILNCTSSTQKALGFTTEKEALTARIDSQIESLNNELEKLREKGNEAGENVSADFRVQLSELEDERQRLEAQKQIVENATEEEWEEIRALVTQNLEEIEGDIKQEIKILEDEFED